MKNILGLDLGTNSIGWAFIQDNKIMNVGSRIIPMSQDVINNFNSGGISKTQTADRTAFRGIRRLRERKLLRRERLHRVLNILGFLPPHYIKSIDFQTNIGQFFKNTEPKLAYNEKNQFIFINSFEEMLNDFKQTNQDLITNGKKIPYDWTIFYLRQKALTQKIKKEELAWIILNFNQKRGYYQLRGEDEEIASNKVEEYYSLKVNRVEESGEKRNDEVWYNVILENGWIYRRSSKIPLFDWEGKYKEFIVTSELDEEGNIKIGKDGKEKRSFKSPKDENWTLLKKKTEHDIISSKKTVGCYIYETLLKNSSQKINGKLIRVIERNFYKEEIVKILEKQRQFHSELNDELIFTNCLNELYKFNENHRNSLKEDNLVNLIINDIIFYQRPLKSKKNLISACKFESRYYIKDNNKETQEIKCIPKSHPLYQEFRLWQWIHNLKVYQREQIVNGKIEVDVNITQSIITNEEIITNLFDFLNNKKEIDQKTLLKFFKLKVETHRWNYIDDLNKKYPCNETKAIILNKLEQVENLTSNFLSIEILDHLWHILYSVEDKYEIKKALTSFAKKYNLNETFIEAFQKMKSFEKDYGAYSAKAIKKLLPLIRVGKYWSKNNIHQSTLIRIEKIINGEYDINIQNRAREKAINLTSIEHFSGLSTWLASYIVYDRHSEEGEIKKWKRPSDIEKYLKEFKQHSLRNPIVEQITTETLRVVRDIWQDIGKNTENFFDEIHVELAREMKNNADERKKITTINNYNEATNLRIKLMLMEFSKPEYQIDNVRPTSPSQQEILKIFENGILNSEILIDPEILKISNQAQPTNAEIKRYKLWMEQRYRSPYTGKIIPLNKLFTTSYEIEHIIPQSRYFDDSLSNKVICESEVNKEKGNLLAYEFILKRGGEKIELNFGQTVEIFKIDQFEKFVKENYKHNYSKLNKLLLDEIPAKFIERQLNDTRYISKLIMGLLSNIVRKEDEIEYKSKQIIVSNGSITSKLRQDWGLNDVWNDLITPRFIRLNELTNSEIYGSINQNTKKFLPKVPIELQKGFNKKRLDHRHHALDAIIVAFTTSNHVNYINNKYANSENERYDLKNKLRHIIKTEIMDNKTGQIKTLYVAKEFIKPSDNFTQDVKNMLFHLIVSFKQNIRILNKTINYYQKWVLQNDGLFKKLEIKQELGDNWSVRKPLHKETVYGKIRIKVNRGKLVNINNAIDDFELIVDRNIKSIIKNKFRELNQDKIETKKYFKNNKITYQNEIFEKISMYEWIQGTATRVKLDDSFSFDKIKNKITDSGIQKILLNHLNSYNTYDTDKIIYHPELAFSPEGIDEMNKNILKLNDNKQHKEIYKVRVYEEGNRYAIGESGNKKDKFVESQKGTNLFFAIYEDENKIRNYETVPLIDVIEHQKQTAHLPKNQKTDIPINLNRGKFLFSLTPNDLVYVPTLEEIENNNLINFNQLTQTQINRVYKIVSSTGTECYFVPNHISTLIKSYDAKSKYGELGSLNKMEKSISGEIIKATCIKIKVNRLGYIEKSK